MQFDLGRLWLWLRGRTFSRVLSVAAFLTIVAACGGAGSIPQTPTVPAIATEPVPTARVTPTAEPPPTRTEFPTAELGLAVAPLAVLPAMIVSRGVGQVGGASVALAVQGSVAYVGVGPRVAAFDVGNPSSPRRIAQSSLLPGLVMSVALRGDVIYVATADSIIVLSARSADLLMQVGDVRLGGQILTMKAVDDELFVGGVGMGSEPGFIAVFDIGIPARPDLAGTILTETRVEGLAVVDGVLVTDSGRVFDFADPLHPEMIAMEESLESEGPIAAPLVLTRAGIVVVADGRPRMLAGNPNESPGLLALAAYRGGIARLMMLCDIGACRGGFSITYEDGLSTANVVLSALDDQLVVVGDLIYGAGYRDGAHRSLWIYEASSDPAIAPSLLTDVRLLGPSTAVTVIDEASVLSVNGGDTLSSVDFSDLDALRVIEQRGFEFESTRAGLVDVESIDGDRIAVTAFVDGLFVSEPGSLDEFAHYDSPSILVLSAEPGVLVTVPLGGVVVLDPITFENNSAARFDSTATALAWTDSKIIVGVSTVVSAFALSAAGGGLVEVARGLFPSSVSGVASAGDWVLVTTRACGFESEIECAARISLLSLEADGFAERGALEVPGETTSVAIGDSGEIYVGTSAAVGAGKGLWIISAEDPANLEVVDFIPLAGAPTDIVVTDSLIIVAADGAGIYFISR